MNTVMLWVAGVLTGALSKFVISEGGGNGQWLDWVATSMGVVAGLAFLSFVILDEVRAMKLKLWHLILGLVLWHAAIALGFWWWLEYYLLPGIG